MKSHRHRPFCNQVARATGESLRCIARMGFSPLREQLPEEDENYLAPQVVDWDLLQQERQIAFYPSR